MMVSEMLWVGRGPDTPLFGPIKECATARQALNAIESSNTAVVPTTDIAKETLLLLGCSEAWATFATGGTLVEWDIVVDL